VPLNASHWSWSPRSLLLRFHGLLFLEATLPELLLYVSCRRTRLPVALSVHHDRLQLLLLDLFGFIDFISYHHTLSSVIACLGRMQSTDRKQLGTELVVYPSWVVSKLQSEGGLSVSPNGVVFLKKKVMGCILTTMSSLCRHCE
jgi:hypothetical protein